MHTRIKKMLAIITATFLTISSFGATAFAQTPASPTINNLKAADYFPSNIDIIYELSTNNSNPFSAWIENAMKMAMMSNTDKAATESLITEIVNNNTLTYGMKTYPPAQNSSPDDYGFTMPDFYAAFTLSPENFKKLMALAGETPTSETYNGITLYSFAGMTYGGQIENMLVLTNKKENLQTVIDNYRNSSRNSLSFNSTYQKIVPHTVQNSFLNMYINTSSVTNQNSELSGQTILNELGINLNQNLAKAITGEGFSVNQTKTGFNFSGTITGDTDTLKSNNLNFNKYNFVPALYKTISGKGLILYNEKTNLKAQIEDALKMINLTGEIGTAYTEFKSELKKQSGIDFDADILSLLTSRYMVTAHYTENLIPSITLAFDVQNKKTEAGNLLVKLNDYLKAEFDKANKESKTTAFQTTFSSLNGVSFYEYGIDLKQLGTEAEASSLETVKIRTGITSEGNLVITNLPDLNYLTSNGRGLNDNSEFAAAFTDQGQDTTGVAYLNFNALKNYIDKIMATFSSAKSDMEAIDQALSSLHDFYLKGFATTDTAWFNGSLKMDVSTLSTVFENLMNIGREYSDYSDPYEDYSQTIEEYLPVDKFGNIKPIGKQLCDVYTNDWYYSYVLELQNKGIIKGYKDGCFHPNQKITRAEFLKMMLCKCVLDQEYPSKFSDVPQDAWYAGYVNYAADQGIVKGLTDGTFHPNDPITRAEAMQMVYNMYTHYEDESYSIPFKDVQNTDWFYKSVRYGYGNFLIDGSGNNMFEPNRHLNRAEAAKIIKNFMDNYYGNDFAPAQ